MFSANTSQRFARKCNFLTL